MNYGLIETQKNNIIENWGQDIFLNMEQELETYTKRWKLSDLEFFEHYSVNLIFFCKSEIYGDCVLKIGGNSQDYEFAAEYNVLREYNGKKYVEVYESDIDISARRKVMLIERVFPGEPLRNEQSLEKRLAVFSELFKGLHIEPENSNTYISYAEFINNDVQNCLKENAGKENIKILIRHINRAKELHFELIEKYNKKMLLHIDLYWGNIVNGGNGRYRIIDPKGVTGDPIFEMGQNLLEECFKYKKQPENIELIFNYFEKSLGIPNRILRQVFYIENVRFVCECNDGLTDWDIERLDFAEKVIKMNWINDTQGAINFIEDNLLENINADDVSNYIHSSSDYFQRIFNIVTGLSISEYIRNRKLTLAGEEFSKTQAKVIDVSMKYGYDSPESFTKAFTRFHGVTPASARVSNSNLKNFYPLSINVYIKGGFNMKRKIIPNIPQIGYYGNETDYSVNLLTATFSIADTKMDRAELAFYSGMANHFCWIEGNWIGSRGCECFGCINETPFQEELRLLKTIGWSAKYVVVNRDKDGTILNSDEEQIKRTFVESIDKGYPILSKLKTHQPKQSIIIGYEDDGDKIVCKAAIEGNPSEGGDHKDAETFVHENWQDIILDYIVLKERLEPIPERRRILEQLKLITVCARRTEKIKGVISSGITAWEAYLHMLEHEDLSALPLNMTDGKDSVNLRLGIYCDGLCQIWERHAALDYYRSLSEKYPEWHEELNTAIAALDECSKYGGFLWTQGFAFEGEGLEKFRDPAARKILADEGRKAMLKDIEAIELFEKILRKEGM